ncbi:DNA-binding response regulator [Tenacibaculum sp. SZ-18]|uniref:LytR/AlgR family response regulator transcription factor n=1 Tax=Tenacibaculum sp. SZ-18 TaxID=754423 RepID=UPI000C2D5DC3|nr:LytTR family DNA-binding domain-containing protein [Tenacibaculum sp. SZ-18]AUC13898.1 DNA-binding response regulator [Tenacibaculum sp. SZ-18]
MKVLIIDDEKRARNVLRILIEENCPKITEICEADNLLTGIELIKQEEPRIVFLDIEMPEHSGLELLNFIEKDSYNFEIIFTTAYSEYAVQAFQLSAIDYLLKPVRPNQVKDAIDRVLNFVGDSQINIRLKELKSSLEKSNFKKIGLPNANGIKFVEVDKIIMFEADGMYTRVSTTEGNIFVSKPLKYFVEALLNIKVFYKPHRSYLVNLTYLREYVKKDGGYIVMENNKCVSISKDKRDEFLAIVQCI